LTPDEYVQYVIDKYTPQTGPGSPAANAAGQLLPVIQNWAGAYLLNVYYSGSYAKGTGIKGESDLDLFISLDSSSDTLGNNYYDLYSFIQKQGYYPTQQNVSIGLTYQNLHVDLIPARKLSGNTDDHYLFVRKADSWKKTNVQVHINTVKNSGRTKEIRAIKIWRNLKSLKFPSIYLELTVIDALYGKSTTQLASNVVTVFEYLKSNFASARVDDPANTNNIISDELETYEKNAISSAASLALSSKWDQVIW
jgi:hypothetical protein